MLLTLNGEATDRIPSNFRAEDVTLEKLFRASGMRKDALCDALDVDIRHIDAIPPAEKKMGSFYQNYWGERYVYYDTEYGRVRDDIAGALHDAQTVKLITNALHTFSEIPHSCNSFSIAVWGFVKTGAFDLILA